MAEAEMASELNDVSVGNTRQLLQQLAGRPTGGGGGGYEGPGVGEISENQPLAPFADVRSCEAHDPALPPEGLAGAMKAQLMTKRENGTKGSEAVEEGVVEPGKAKHIREQLREQAERGGRVQKEAIVIDKQAQPIISENHPYQRHGIIREADQSESEKGLVLAAGHARQIASALLSPREDSKGERSLVNVKEDTEGPSIVENHPTTRTDVVHCHDRINDLPSVDPGFAKGLAMQFVQKKHAGEPKVKDVMVLPGATEAGVFENQPTTREGVVRESDKLEETDVIPDKVTSAMRQVWLERGVLVELAKPNQPLSTASQRSPVVPRQQKSAASGDVGSVVTSEVCQLSDNTVTHTNEVVSGEPAYESGHEHSGSADSVPVSEHYTEVHHSDGGGVSDSGLTEPAHSEPGNSDGGTGVESNTSHEVGDCGQTGVERPGSGDHNGPDVHSGLTAPSDLPDPDNSHEPVTDPGPDNSHEPVTDPGPDNSHEPVTDPDPDNSHEPVTDPDPGQSVPCVADDSRVAAECNAGGDEGSGVTDHEAEGRDNKVTEHSEGATEQGDKTHDIIAHDSSASVADENKVADGSDTCDSMAAACDKASKVGEASHNKDDDRVTYTIISHIDGS